mmetsp:Transcript_48564/g.96827  ORF Transcript_48564/g.96827 Transcript_48564/m.96827 type:complete len:218 (+) Transcript_48564:466-1119(+)
MALAVSLKSARSSSRAGVGLHRGGFCLAPRRAEAAAEAEQAATALLGDRLHPVVVRAQLLCFFSELGHTVDGQAHRRHARVHDLLCLMLLDHLEHGLDGTLLIRCLSPLERLVVFAIAQVLDDEARHLGDLDGVVEARYCVGRRLDRAIFHRRIPRAVAVSRAQVDEACEPLQADVGIIGHGLERSDDNPRGTKLLARLALRMLAAQDAHAHTARRA